MLTWILGGVALYFFWSAWHWRRRADQAEGRVKLLRGELAACQFQIDKAIRECQAVKEEIRDLRRPLIILIRRPSFDNVGWTISEN